MPAIVREVQEDGKVRIGIHEGPNGWEMERIVEQTELASLEEGRDAWDAYYCGTMPRSA